MQAAATAPFLHAHMPTTPQDLCIRSVAQHFEDHPSFGNLPDKLVKKVVSLLALDLPLELVGTVRPRLACLPRWRRARERLLC